MDLVKLLMFLTETGTKYNAYTDKECIDDEAVKDGAVFCICVRDQVNFNFDERGTLMGTSTNNRNSYVKRK